MLDVKALRKILFSKDSYEDSVAWVNIEGYCYKLHEIDDKYLSNIINFVYNGGGHIFFVNKERMGKLFDEATNRKLSFNFTKEEFLKDVPSTCSK